MWINLNDFLIVADYAKHIGKTETRIRQLIRENKLPYIEHNGRKLIPKTGVLPDYIKEQRQGGVKMIQNPIKDNRIVFDRTFAIRLKAFVEKIHVCDCAGEEEKDYILLVANDLIKYQVETATDEEEVNYLKRLGLL